MHIDLKSYIAGYPALDIQKLMRRATQMWTIEFVAEVLGIVREEADELVHRLEKERYVERVPDRDERTKRAPDGYAVSASIGSD